MLLNVWIQSGKYIHITGNDRLLPLWNVSSDIPQQKHPMILWLYAPQKENALCNGRLRNMTCFGLKKNKVLTGKDRFLACIAQSIGQPCLHGRTELHEKSSDYACMAGQISTLLLLFAIQSEIWQSRLNPFALHTHVRSRQADRNRTAYYCLFKSAGRSERG